MSSILTIIKKELKRFFTDKKLLFTLLFPGILIYLVYSVMGDAMLNKFSVDESYEYIVYTINEPQNSPYTETFKSISNPEGMKIKLETGSDSEIEDLKEKLRNKEIDLIIYYVGDFNTVSSEPNIEKPNIEIYQNATKTESATIYEYYVNAFDMIEDGLCNLYNINKDIISDVSTDKEKQVSFMTMLLPLLVMMLLFSGCMAVVPESIAGEKERGTIATLLITPLKRRELAIGKIVSLSIVSVCSALSSFIGVVLSLPKLMGSQVSGSIYGFKEYALVLLVLITTVLLFVTILSILSAQSKSVKEAGMYTTPVMILVMVVSMALMFTTNNNVNIGLCFIPIYNTAVMLKTIFSFEVNVLGVIITVISNAVYTGVGIYLLTRMFNSERVMFNK